MKNATKCGHHIIGHHLVKMRRSEKTVNEYTYEISSIERVTAKFLKFSHCSRAKQRNRNVQKVCYTCKVAFLLIRPIVVFHHSRCLRRLALHDFIFCLSKL